MSRSALSRRVAVILGIAAVAAAAATVGCLANGASDSTVEPIDLSNPDCDPNEPECLERIRSALRAQDPTPAPPEADAKVRELLFEDGVIKAIVAGRDLGRDYWMQIQHWSSARGELGATVTIVFAEPVSYAGQVPTESNPCAGHYGPDERIDPDDPCLDEPREYGTTYKIFADTRIIHAKVEVGRGEVVHIFDMHGTPDMIERMIEQFKRN